MMDGCKLPLESGSKSVRRSRRQGAFIQCLLELIADPRNGVPMHIHQNEDELFVVLEGSLHIASGDQRFDAPAGTAVTIGKGVPHAWCNLTNAPLRMLVIFSPGNIED